MIKETFHFGQYEVKDVICNKLQNPIKYLFEIVNPFNPCIITRSPMPKKIITNKESNPS